MNYTIFFSLYSLAHKSVFMDHLIVFSANIFPLIMLALAVIFLFFHHEGVFDFRRPFLQIKNKIREIIFVFSSAITAYIISFIIKTITQAPRPFVVFNTVKPLFMEVPMHSFPSGHATVFAALATALYLRHRKLGIIYIIATIIICLARVAAGVHFPLDIFAGLVIGIAVAFVFDNFLLPKVSQTPEI